MNPNGQKLGDAWLVADFGETDTDGCDTISTFLPAGYMPQSDVVMPSPTPSSSWIWPDSTEATSVEQRNPVYLLTKLA